MRKTILIVILSILVIILSAIIFRGPDEDIEKEYAREIIDDIRKLLVLPEDKVFINVITNSPEPVGDMEYFAWVKGDPKVNQYTIYLTHRARKYNLPMTLAHEMIHIQQMVSGRLIVESSDNSVTFKGTKYTAKQWLSIPYRNRPWEAEAYILAPTVEALLKIEEGK